MPLGRSSSPTRANELLSQVDLPCPDARASLVIPGILQDVKVAASIPDPLFAEADRLARRRKMSRSQLYSQALEMFVANQDDADITRRLDEIYGDVDSRLDAGLLNAQLEAVREEWPGD